MTGVQESLKKAMKGATKKQGKKGRKFGRSKRGGAMAHYNATSRDKVNKTRKVAKHNAAVKGKANNPPATPRGTARKLARTGILSRAERKGYIQHAKPADTTSSGT